MSTYRQQWLASPDGGETFSNIRDSILSHDQSCSSLEHAWLPRRKGTTSLGDIMGCEICDLTFFWEGVVGLFDDCPESFWYFCSCCADKIVDCPCGGPCKKESSGQDATPVVDMQA